MADFDKKVASKYGVLCPDGVPLRALFIIDPAGTTHHTPYFSDLLYISYFNVHHINDLSSWLSYFYHAEYHINIILQSRFYFTVRIHKFQAQHGSSLTPPSFHLLPPTKSGAVRQITINDLMVGRNVDEIIRLIKAHQFVEVRCVLSKHI